MEIRLLRSFVVLAEERHFSRAAVRLNIAQPALSQQLKQLEREVGSTLLDRSTRRANLTPAGELLRERATEILAAVDRVRHDLDLVADGRLGVIRIGFVGTATYDVLPQVAKLLRRELPHVELELRGESLGPELIDAVQDRALDLAILRPIRTPRTDLVVHPIRTEPLVVALPQNHRLADEPRVRLADLSDETFVTHLSHHRSMMQPLVVQACHDAGFEPRDLVEVRETCTIVVFVAAGLGVALVPASVQSLGLEGVVYRPLQDTRIDVPLAIIHRPEPGPVTRRVVEIVTEIAGRPARGR